MLSDEKSAPLAVGHPEYVASIRAKGLLVHGWRNTMELHHARGISDVSNRPVGSPYSQRLETITDGVTNRHVRSRAFHTAPWFEVVGNVRSGRKSGGKPVSKVNRTKRCGPLQIVRDR